MRHCKERKDEVVKTSNNFDVTKQKNFLIDQGWAYTGKFPHRWNDPIQPYDENVTIDIAAATEVARSRIQMLRATEPPEICVSRSRLFEILNETQDKFQEVGCSPQSGEIAAIDRIRRSLKQEFNRIKRRTKKP